MFLIDKFKQKYIDEGKQLGIEEGKQIGKQEAHDEGYRSGFDIGQELGIQIGHRKGIEEANDYLSNTLVPSYEYYINQLLEVINIQKEALHKIYDVHNEVRPQTELQAVETMMTWAKDAVSVLDTSFFKNTHFQSYNSNSIKTMIDGFTYINSNSKIKWNYPNTYQHLPKIIQKLEEIYKNKLTIEEAEKAMRNRSVN